jgi:hypothetical protein
MVRLCIGTRFLFTRGMQRGLGESAQRSPGLHGPQQGNGWSVIPDAECLGEHLLELDNACDHVVAPSKSGYDIEEKTEVRFEVNHDQDDDEQFA